MDQIRAVEREAGEADIKEGKTEKAAASHMEPKNRGSPRDQATGENVKCSSFCVLESI